MSKGPGRWQRELLAVTEGGLVRTTREVALDLIPEPSRSDSVSIRRAAKALALDDHITAYYAYACLSCGAIRRGGHGCCDSVRPMLAVAPRGVPFHRLVSPAPPPVRPAPSWISVAAVVYPPVPPGVASVQDALDLVIGLGAERLRSGKLKVDARAMIGAPRLRQQVEADCQPTAENLEQFVRISLGVAREQLGAGGFDRYSAEVTRRYKAVQSRPGW